MLWSGNAICWVFDSLIKYNNYIVLADFSLDANYPQDYLFLMQFTYIFSPSNQRGIEVIIKSSPTAIKRVGKSQKFQIST